VKSTSSSAFTCLIDRSNFSLTSATVIPRASRTRASSAPISAHRRASSRDSPEGDALRPVSFDISS
jgi:hypothetical protein